jgi:hypothetical protein
MHKVFASLFLLVAIAVAQTPGGRLILSTQSVNNLIKKQLPYIKQAVLASQIPELNVEESVPVIGKVDVTVSNMKITGVDFGPFQVGTRAPNLVSAGTTSCALTFTAHYHYRRHAWPHVSGSGDVTGSTSGDVIQVTISIDMQNGKPVFKLAAINVQIATFKLHFEHSTLAWLMNLIEGLFKKSMRDLVSKSVTGALTDLVNNKLNAAMDRTHFAREVKYGNLDFVFDASLANGGVAAQETFLSLSSIVTSFAPGKKDFPPFQPVTLPTSLITQDLANVFISDYVFNSASYALHNSGQLKLPILPTDVPDWSPIKLNTTSLKLYLPELYAKYPDKNVQVDIKTTAYPQIAIRSGVVNMQANTTLLFRVYTDATSLQNAFIVSLGIVGQFVNASIASLSGGAVINFYGAIQHTTSEVKLVESFIGDVNVTTFGKILQLFVINGQVSKLNAQLKAGIPIDLNAAVPGVTVDNSKLFVKDGYVAVTGDVNYTPPRTRSDDLIDLILAMSKKIDTLKQQVEHLESKVETCNK